MARVKSNVASRARKKKVLKLAKGYFGSKHRLYRTANEQVMRSQRYAFIGRKQVKREMRKLWITRINAGARLNGISYSQLTFGLRLADIQINRKMLSEMAIHDAAGFTAIVEIAKNAIANQANAPKAVKEVVVEEVVATPAVEENVTVDTADYGSNWADVVYNIIDRHVSDDFTTEDVLAHSHIAAAIYPKNTTIEATIKRNIASLVKDGKVVEVEVDSYKKVK